MIQLEHLGHGFGGHVLFRDVSLTIAAGQRVALSGPSGSGKTTFLSLLAGLVGPDQGVIRLRGDTASTAGRVIMAPHKRGIGVVFQQSALWPHMSVAQNVLFGLGGFDGQDRASRLEQALHQTGCAPLADRKPDTLSGGEQRRVALARALAPGPRIVLLDEPLANLDDTARADLVAMIARVTSDSGATVIHVSHDASEARGYCDRFLRLENASLCETEEAPC